MQTYFRAMQALKEAQVSALVTLFERAWPAMEGLLKTFGVGSPPPLPAGPLNTPSLPPLSLDPCLEVVDSCCDILLRALYIAGAPLHPYAVRFATFLTWALGQPTVGPHSSILKSTKRILLFVKRMEQDVSAPGTPTPAPLSSLRALVHSLTLSSLKASLTALSPSISILLSPRGNVGERITMAGMDTIEETLDLATVTLDIFPGGILEENECLLSPVLSLTSAALAAAQPRLALAVVPLLQTLGEVALKSSGAGEGGQVNPARTAAINSALSTSYAELIRVSFHSHLLFFFLPLAAFSCAISLTPPCFF